MSLLKSDQRALGTITAIDFRGMILSGQMTEGKA